MFSTEQLQERLAIELQKEIRCDPEPEALDAFGVWVEIKPAEANRSRTWEHVETKRKRTDNPEIAAASLVGMRVMALWHIWNSTVSTETHAAFPLSSEDSIWSRAEQVVATLRSSGKIIKKIVHDESSEPLQKELASDTSSQIQHVPSLNLHVFICERITLTAEWHDPIRGQKFRLSWHCEQDSGSSDLFSFHFQTGEVTGTANPDKCLFLLSDKDASNQLTISLTSLDGTHKFVSVGSLDKMPSLETFSVHNLQLRNTAGKIAKATLQCAGQMRWTVGKPPEWHAGSARFLEPADDPQSKHIFNHFFPHKPL